MSSLLSRRGRIRCFLLIQLKPNRQGFKTNAATRELNTSGHQKHDKTTGGWNIVETSRWWCLGFNWI